MFSSRTDWDIRPTPLFSLLQQKRGNGNAVLDLTESNPTRCGFTFLSDFAIDADLLARTAAYEPDPKGLPEARQAIAAWYFTQGVKISPDQIVLTASTSEAYSWLLRLLCDAGDVIAIPKPGYPLFEYLARLNDVECSRYRLAYDGEWHLETRSFGELRGQNLKATILVHPNNPTGSFIKLAERDRIVSQASATGTVLIVDEVFHSFPFAPDPLRAGSFAGTEEVLTFTVNGLSKLAGMPQMKLAWIIVSGPATAARTALEKLEVIGDTYLSVGTPVQHALGAILHAHTTLNERLTDRVVTNYHELVRVFAAGSPGTLFRAEGGWNAMLRLPATRSDEEWAHHLLEDGGVLVHPGSLFESDIASCIVISLLPPTAVFTEGIETLERFLSTQHR